MTFIQSAGTSSPVFDYSSRDYTSTLTDLLNRQQVWLPEWTSSNNNDFGVVLMEIYAYCSDILHYYIDRVANESFLQTATQPQSVLNLAAMIGYTPYLSVGSNVTLQITISQGMQANQYPIDIPAGTVFSTSGTPAQPPVPFVTQNDLVIPGTTVTPAVYTGTVPAVQGQQYVNELVATSNGSINQVYRLLNNPVSAYSTSIFIDLGYGPQEWVHVDSLIGAGPNGMVWTDYTDANQVFYIGLGDGVNGYVPPIGCPITATYMTNSGGLGNVGPNTVVNYTGPPAGSSGGSRPIGLAAVTNPLGAEGGAYAESTSSIQANAPASLRTLHRGVTVTDIGTLAQDISGFAWASAVEVTYQLVNLYMCPNGGGQVSSLQQQNILNTMQQLVMANTTIVVLSPIYQALDINVTVYAYANFSNQTVKTSVLAALTDMLAIANTGFSARIGLGLVYQVIDSVPGVNWSNVTTMRREVMCTLTSPLNQGTTYNSISVSMLPQALNPGDQLILTNPFSGQQQQIGVGAGPSAGSYVIGTAPFVANATYPAGQIPSGASGPVYTTVMDQTYLGDAVFLPSEIPMAGLLNVIVIGGTLP